MPPAFPIGLSPVELMRRAHEARGRRIRRGARRLFRLALAALALAALLRLAVIEPVAVADDAMAQGTRAASILLVDKAAYGWSAASLPAPLRRMLAAALALGEGGDVPAGQRLMARPVARGDLLAFAAGPSGGDIRVARVIALAGERVAIRDGRVGPAQAAAGELRVPPGHLLVDCEPGAGAAVPAAPVVLVADAQVIGRARRLHAAGA